MLSTGGAAVDTFQERGERGRGLDVVDHDNFASRQSAPGARHSKRGPRVVFTSPFWFKECSPPPETSGPTPPTGAPRLDSQGYSALSDYLLTYSLSLSRSLPPYLPRARHQAHILDPFDEGLVPCLACLLLHAIGAAVNQITGLLPPRVWRAIRKKKGEKNAAPRLFYYCDSRFKIQLSIFKIQHFQLARYPDMAPLHFTKSE